MDSMTQMKAKHSLEFCSDQIVQLFFYFHMLQKLRYRWLKADILFVFEIEPAEIYARGLAPKSDSEHSFI